MALTDGIGSALSGAAAAASRFNVSANNVANIQSRGAAPEEAARPQDSAAQPEREQGFQPLRAIDQSREGGGVQSTTRPISPASIPILQESAAAAEDGQRTEEEGTGFLPNVDPANEAVQQITSQRQFEANLRTVQSGLQLNQSLLDINS